jgi:hypothetical protein
VKPSLHRKVAAQRNVDVLRPIEFIDIEKLSVFLVSALEVVHGISKYAQAVDVLFYHLCDVRGRYF